MTLQGIPLYKRAMNVVCGIIIQKDRLLLTKRPRERSYGGLWEFPGGKVRQQESFEQALVRELDEELGIQAENLKGIGSIVSQDGRIHLHAFFATFQGIFEVREHMALAWATPGHIKQYDLCPNDRDLLEKFPEILTF